MIQMEQIGEVKKFQLARSIFGKPLYFTTSYWIGGIMIDTGCAYTVNELLSALDNLPVRLVINTHSHEDHIGGNAAIQGKHRVKVMVHPLAVPVLADPKKHQPLHLYQRIMWGYPAPSQASRLSDHVETEDHCFEVMHTPGHSADHVCFYEAKKGWMFSGDAYIGGMDRALRQDYNIWQIIASLKEIADRDPDVLFPGSGHVRRRPKKEINKKIEYLNEIGERILALYKRGLSDRQIRKRLLGRERRLAYLTMGNFSGANLVRSYLTHHPNAPVSG
jgi:glyoxylase-like metal-dependent hydrolase (beta-lactamase superfamily II)